MDLALNNQQRLICHKTQATNQPTSKRIVKKLDRNRTRKLPAIFNKAWKQHPTKQQLYGHLPPISKTMQIGRIRLAGNCWRSKNDLIREILQ